MGVMYTIESIYSDLIGPVLDYLSTDVPPGYLQTPRSHLFSPDERKTHI